MMNTNLFNAFCNSTRFSYYRIQIFPNELFDSTSAQLNCEDFIRRHFEKGKKGEALNFPPKWKDVYLSKGKHVHTVALYLTGLLLENLFTNEIRKSLKSKITDMSWYDFRYTWFLTCLFHDAASSIEGLQVDNCSCGLDETLKKLDVTITPFTYTPLQPHAELTCYNWDTIDAYYKFEMDRCGDAFCAEHGIIGGCMLFDRLYKNFKSFVGTAVLKEGSSYIKDGLSWRIEHLDHFAYICDAIICHNLWTVSQGYDDDDYIQIEKYHKFNLDDLIIPNPNASPNSSDKRIGFHQQPLQFMLRLLDSLEPVKFFAGDSIDHAKFVLSHTAFCRADNAEGITISWDEALTSSYSVALEQWCNKIFGLPRWLKVCIKIPDNRSISIIFN